MWKLKSAVRNDVLVHPRVLSDGDIPVFLNVGGDRVFEIDPGYPHVKVSLAVTNDHISGYYVTANGGRDSYGYRKHWIVAANVPCGELKPPHEIESLIASLADQIEEAIERCRNLNSLYAAATQRLSILKKLLPECHTRAGYEQACVTAGVAALHDHEIFKSYQIGFGDYAFPAYQPDHIIMMGLAAERKRSLMESARASSNAQQYLETPVPIKRCGQLWEPCGCGREPVYMPLHLCDLCWPQEA